MSNTWPVLVRNTQATPATRLSETPLLLLGTEKHNASVGQKNQTTPKTLHNSQEGVVQQFKPVHTTKRPITAQNTRNHAHTARCQPHRPAREKRPQRENSTSAPSCWGPRVFPRVHSPQRLRQGKKWAPEVCAPKFLTDLLPTVTSCHWSLSFSTASSPCCFHLGYEH